MVGVKVKKKLQFDISMTEPQLNLHHAYKKKNMYGQKYAICKKKQSLNPNI